MLSSKRDERQRADRKKIAFATYISMAQDAFHSIPLVLKLFDIDPIYASLMLERIKGEMNSFLSKALKEVEERKRRGNV